MFTDSVDKATTKTAGSPVYSLWLGLISELFLVYIAYMASNMKISTRILGAAQNSSRRQVGGLMSERELKLRLNAFYFGNHQQSLQDRIGIQTNRIDSQLN